ncbi:hypothetical protein [Nonomuraea rubra]|uniref:NAD(P)-dependent dehydrogenase (Short-subunit alcohol dehydrogenase family) n=1 Tax=Nonomuraea rubra TaxID=46180 RepID=A0A7X0NX54_9ACTN|nr:hypothetical protein [Nonomuraea rubra]MBB6551262.1 NAD(P)-dependent dehydrogenase (short-subunit alcohol dehydrogenase family) [Nonomuraea rubra]
MSDKTPAGMRILVASASAGIGRALAVCAVRGGARACCWRPAAWNG